jgi:hypothetical protein
MEQYSASTNDISLPTFEMSASSNVPVVNCDYCGIPKTPSKGFGGRELFICIARDCTRPRGFGSSSTDFGATRIVSSELDELKKPR